MPEFAGSFRSVGSLLVIGAGVRIITRALPKKRLIPKPAFRTPKAKPFKIRKIKMRRF